MTANTSTAIGAVSLNSISARALRVPDSRSSPIDNAFTESLLGAAASWPTRTRYLPKVPMEKRLSPGTPWYLTPSSSTTKRSPVALSKSM